MASIFRLLRFLVRLSGERRATRAKVIAVILFGVASGACSAAFIGLINTAINSEDRNRLVAGFVALCVLLPILRFLSAFLLIRVSQGTQFELSLKLCRRFLASPLRDLERLGSARLLATLTDDVQMVVNSVSNLPLLLMHVTVILGSLVYLAWLSWPVLLLVLFCLVLGVVSYRLPMRWSQAHFDRARESWDRLLGHYTGLADGMKELKVNAARRRDFLLDQLEPAARSRMHHVVAGNTLFSAASSWGQVIFFVLIGVLLFVVPGSMGVNQEVLTGYTLAIFYMLSPLEVILNQIPVLGRGAIAVSRIDRLGVSLEGIPEEELLQDPAPPAPSWRSLELAGVTHTYYREEVEERFTLGPLDLTLRPAETVFVVGGNGSGKTTLAKILLGLYTPASGRILLDGEPVTAESLDRYRQLFSAVFSDFFLFDTLLGLEQADLDDRARHYLSVLLLERKLSIRDGKLSTLELSQGQRKRLALLTAYLEDRPIYVFDEWAADQDPSFKRVFYRELLPDLTRRGKAVVVISHDDAYFDAADRIVKLGDGHVESEKARELAPSPGPLTGERSGDAVRGRS